jgi:hypothetical protein
LDAGNTSQDDHHADVCGRWFCRFREFRLGDGITQSMLLSFEFCPLVQFALTVIHFPPFCQNIFALSTLAPYFVAATTTVKDELGNTFALLTRQDLRDAKTHGKLVRLEDQEGRITKIDLNSITFQ